MILNGPLSAIGDEFLRLRLRCPQCRAGHSNLQPDHDRHITCRSCGRQIGFDNKAWDARVTDDYPRDFSTQWDLWQKGVFGCTRLVYGKTQDEDFQEVLNLLGLSVGDLSDKKVLEVGFGHGRILYEFQKHCAIGLGLDLARPADWLNFRRGSILCSSLFDIPLMPGQFDIVICRGVIHSTPDARLAFNQVVEQLAPGGKLYLYVHEKFKPRSVLLRQILPYSWKCPFFVRLAVSHLIGIIAAGFRVLKEGCLSVGRARIYHGDYTL